MNASNSSGLFTGCLGGESVLCDKANISYKLFEIYNIYNFVVDAVFVLPTIFGNALILAALGRFKGLRKSISCILIGNLAVSDILVGLIVFPLDMLIRMRRSMFGMMDCLLFYCLVYTAVGASVLNLFLLSIERFHAITFPLRHNVIFTKGRIYLTMVIVWICTFSVGFLPLFGWHDDVEEDTFVCGAVSVLPETFIQIVSSVLVLSLIVNSILFFIIANIAIKSAKTFIDLTRTVEEHERLKKSIHHTKMMLIVSGLFIVFWGPFCVASLVPKPSSTLKFVKSWLSSFGLINSALNWIVYGCRSMKFRMAFKAILTCNCSKAEADISSING